MVTDRRKIPRDYARSIDKQFRMFPDMDRIVLTSLRIERTSLSQRLYTQ
jgi:hypothetical protein